MRMRVTGQKTLVSNTLFNESGINLLTCFVAFGEDAVVVAHPSKSGSDWWYGTLVGDERSGFFPKTYVQTIQAGMSVSSCFYGINPNTHISHCEGSLSL